VAPTTAPGHAAAPAQAPERCRPVAPEPAAPALPGDLKVPVLVVQHMPPTFTRLLAERLDGQSGLRVHEATSGMVAYPGHLYIAPGGSHMVVRCARQEVVIDLDGGPPENSCRPSVDVLFRSAAATWGAGVLAVVLTGMGQDGLLGSRAVIAAGGTVIAQDEASSVVWGMPGAVVKVGLAADVAPIGDIAAHIVRRTRNDVTPRRSSPAGGHASQMEQP